MSNQTYKPEWNSTISPYLMVDNVEKEIAFIKEVFGGELVEVPRSPDGKIFHAEIKIDDSVIMIGRSDERWPSLKGNIHIYVEDIDQVYERALAAGATTLSEPKDMFYGNREAGFVDPLENQWWLAKLIKPMSEQQITDNHPGGSTNSNKAA